MEDSDLILARGKLKVAVNKAEAGFNLEWDGTKITRTCGFISIVVLACGKRYYSNQAVSRVNRLSECEFEVILKWDELCAEEQWRISLKDSHTIQCEVYFKPLKDILLQQHEIGLMLSADYTEWFTPLLAGKFPEIKPFHKDWQDIPLTDNSSKSMGVKSSTVGSTYKPAVVMDFKEMQQCTEIQIKNSHIYDNLRGMLVIVKPQVYSEKYPLGQKNLIFNSQIKIFDSIVQLTKHLGYAKKEHIKQREQIGLSGTNKDFIFGVFPKRLIARFKEHYRNKGFLYAFYRGLAYAVYQAKGVNPIYYLSDRVKFKKFMETASSDILLEKGKLKMLINPAMKAARIYWCDIELTKDSGLITILADKSATHKRHYSNQAYWHAEILSSNQAHISLRHRDLPLLQEWMLTLDDRNCITWDTWITPERNLVLAEEETGIMLSSDYTHWLNSYEEGNFADTKGSEDEWLDVSLWNINSKSIGVRAASQNGLSRPAVILDFKETKTETRPVIRNSDYRANLRLLLVQGNTGSTGRLYSRNQRTNIFSGTIQIIAEDSSVSQYIIECKKTLYRQRLPFIEEKMTKKYLSGILRPVEVVLANMPWQIDGKSGVRAGSRWPHIKNKEEETYLPFPFFLAYAASLLLENGIRVRIIDAIAENMHCEDFIRLVNEINPRLLIAEVSTPSMKNDLEILKKIERRNTKIAVCGLDFNIRNPEFLAENDFIDFVMFGEYEYTSLELFNSLDNEKKLKEVLGLIYRVKNRVVANPARPLAEEIDALPWPLREQLPMEQYIDAPGKLPTPSVQMISSRGCPFGCIFCAWPQLMYDSRRYRVRKPEAVVDEMEYLIKERRFRSVYFDDDTFNIDKDNVIGICRQIKERKLDIPWAIMARADTMDEEMLLKAKESGLYAVKYGVESADQKLLDSVGKGMDLKKAERMIKFTKSLGIKIHLTFTFGLPEETPDTVKRSIDYAMSLDPDTVQFSIMTPYPGTNYYKQLDLKGHIVSKNWSDYDGASKSVIRTEHLTSRDLEKAKEEALKRWKKHRRSKKSFINLPFDEELRIAFKNNLERKGLMSTLVKTVKYIFSIP